MTGHPRPDGRFGVRDHVLVLPSVVCSTNAAERIARESGAVAITHQHGCLHVGDDLRHTERALIGTATNPNVGAVVVVSLGCETIQGRRLARRIEDRGQRVAFVGIQAEGGTERAVAAGVAAVGELRAVLDAIPPEPLPAAAVTVGIDRPRDPLAPALTAALAGRGWAVVDAPGDLSAAESHVALAAAGAQVIVSLRGPGEAPLGFAVCPVIAVARDPALYAALRDDFDLPDEDAERTVADVVARVDATLAGEPTASERRGARDFVLRRLAMTM
ncbi:MAG: UxaA family hydrolase [Solirubrobacteraceae bacterium]|nr:UxaA family hydrolase [Solirubrobacteraceae bacterium]